MVKQLSVFLQNKSGKIAVITRLLHEHGIDIRALSIADTADFGILRMLVSDIKAAQAAITGQNCIASTTEVVVVAVPDRPGGLADILSIMSDGGIDIEYMYSLITHGDSCAYMVFRVSDEEKLLSLLSEHSIQTVTQEQLGLK